MVPSKAIDIKRMRGNFSCHAGDYDRYASVQKRVVALLSRKLSGFERNGGVLLDVGTGTGALAAEILCSGSGQSLVVMDIAHGMTLEAVNRMPAVLACDGDARSLPFANDKFSTVVSSSVYQWVACLPSAFSEVGRVLMPGGLFVLALFGAETLCELRASHRQATDENHDRRVSHVQSFPSLQEVSAALGLAGMTCLELHSTMEVEYHADVPELLRHLKQIGASNAAADRPRGLASRRVMQAMMKIYDEGYRCEAGVPASYEVIIAVAEKPRL